MVQNSTKRFSAREDSFVGRGLTAEAHREEVVEMRAQFEAGVLDVGQSDGEDGLCSVTSSSEDREGLSGHPGRERCFFDLCENLGVSVDPKVTSPAGLSKSQLVELAAKTGVYVGCVVYGEKDHKNHVVALEPIGKSGTLTFVPKFGVSSEPQVTYAITNPQEFFNQGGRFYRHHFFADQAGEVGAQDMSDFAAAAGTFGGDSASSKPVGQFHYLPDQPRGPVAESIVGEGELSGSNNISGGVTRSRRRVVKGIANYDDVFRPRRTYHTSGTTMFNNVDEMYLNIISRDYAQEIMEELFRLWGLPKDQPDAMQYAEDLLFAFIVARTASNKADYNASFDVPVKGGEIEVSFSALSVLLADKYGLTRRNFSRGLADDVRKYLNRPENQLVKSRSAQRVGADPQYGDLCFDGSTGCTAVTSSEMTFCRLLEGRNLYERDDLIAEGASEKLMQGIHGGVRSVVRR